MNTEVLVPYWLIVLLALLSVALLVDRLLIPSVRWFLRRRVNRVIEEVNTRLDIEIRPFQLTRRQVLIEQLVFDERVNEAAQEYAREKGMPRAVAQTRVRRYAREIVPSFNAMIYFRLGYWLARRIARLIYRVRVGFYDDGAMSKIDSNATVVFVMNHRSNMDYILVALLAAERTALSYAVGEWARIWPLTMLVKAMGAFFVRRNSGNPLYRRVLERYVHMATRAGVCQAVFMEGGLSKDGSMRAPRLGFLDYMLRGYDPKNDRDIVFIPVGINYDRVLEDRSQVRRLNPDARKKSAWFIIKTTLRFAFRNMMLSRRVRWRRFGYACVNFGLPLSAKEYCMSRDMVPSEMEQAPRFVEVEKLANSLMDRIRQVIPVLPVSLVATVILEEADAEKTRLIWMGKALQRIEHFRKQGAPINISPTACERVLEGAMDILLGRGLLQQRDGLISAHPGSRELLAYYANAIRHW